MKKLLLASAAILMSVGSAALASTIDLTDNIFVVTGAPGFPGLGPTAFTETTDGVTFTFFNPSSRGTNQFRIDDGGLDVGGGGNTAFSFDFSVSQDVTLTGYAGYNQRFLEAPSLQLSQGMTVLDSGVAFTGEGFGAGDATQETFSGGGTPLLTAGLTYSVTVINSSARTQGALTAIDFEAVSTSPVPLPAGLPLLLAGIGGFAWMRRRQS